MRYSELYEELARVAYETMFEERWDDLHPQSIERAMWLSIVRNVMAKYEKLYSENAKVSA